MKKSLIFWFAAVTCAAWILVGCEQETKTEYRDVPGDTVGFQPPADAVEADDLATLEALLADTSGLYTKIVYEGDPGAAITVTAGKTLYLNADSDITLSAGIAVIGKLVVYNGELTPDSNLTGTGTLDVEAGGGLVSDDTLFPGPGGITVSIKKYASLETTATVDTDAKIKAWLTRAGEGRLTLTVTVLTPEQTLAAIGSPAPINYFGRSVPKVAVTNNVEPAGGTTTLTVPAGVLLITSGELNTLTSLTVNGGLIATSADLNALTSLTVNGSLSASGPGATAGVAITLGANADVSFTSIGKLAANITVPAGASFEVLNVTDSNDKTITYTKGSKNVISDIDLTFSGISSITGWTLANDITLTTGQTLFVPAGATKIVVSAGKKITNAGTITLGDGVSLVLATPAATTGGAQIEGAGSLIAGATTITGTWEAVGKTDNASSVAITSGASGVGATIAVADTNAIGLKAGAAGATITQAAGTSNVLTIAVDTTIDLGGTAAAVGAIVLIGDGTNPGEIKLVDAATSIVKTGNTVGGDAFGTAAKIGTKTFATGGAGKAAIYTTVNGAAGKIAQILGGTGNYGLKGGDSSNTITIDGSADVAASG